MGVSDVAHARWLGGAVARFDRQSGLLGALAARERIDVCGLGQQADDPVTRYLAVRAGAERVHAIHHDRFPSRPGVKALDLNDLSPLPDAAFDVAVLFRASYFVERPAEFLAGVARALRPGGLLFVDWLNGRSDEPDLGLDGAPVYAGVRCPYRTTYCDAEFVTAFPREFARLIAHVNRPPRSLVAARRGARLSARARAAGRLRSALGFDPKVRTVTPASYLATLRADLAAAGRQLVAPETLSREFEVVFRDARYFFPQVRKFNLYLLTVLRSRRRP
jgi:SAM-dependent methyltransferase